MTNKKRQEVEMAVLYVVLSRLMMPADKFDAYDLGLIDKSFKILREPTNDVEEDAMSPLNVFVFTLKNAFGSKIMTLFKFLYLNNYKDDFVLDKLMTKSIISSRSEVKRIAKDLKKKSKRG
jgi:hypothetical protein